MAIIVKIDDEKKPDRLTAFIYGMLLEYCTYGQMDTVINEISSQPQHNKNLLALAEELADRIMPSVDPD